MKIMPSASQIPTANLTTSNSTTNLASRSKKRNVQSFTPSTFNFSGSMHPGKPPMRDSKIASMYAT